MDKGGKVITHTGIRQPQPYFQACSQLLSVSDSSMLCYAYGFRKICIDLGQHSHVRPISSISKLLLLFISFLLTENALSLAFPRAGCRRS